MRRKLGVFVVLVGSACGGATFNSADGGGDGGSASSSGSSGSGSGTSSGSGSSSGTGAGSSSSSSGGGASSSSSGSASSSGSSSGASSGGSTDGGHLPIDHRPSDSQCATPRPAGDCSFTGVGFMCKQDSQCTDGGADGRCITSGGGPAGCYCTYDACRTDTDCSAGELCVCHGSAYSYGGNRCMPGNCRVDSDCGVGGYCSPAPGTGGCGYVTGYYCHTHGDLCTNDSDCPGGDVCTWSAAMGRWECQLRQLCP